MEVEEAVEDTDPQQVFAEYGDNGELDLDYGGLLAEVEQEPDTTPVHSAPAAYEDISPPRSRPTSQPSSRPSDKEATAAAKEHRPISFLEWQKKTKSGDEKEPKVKDGAARSARHQDRDSPRRRDPEGSRHKELPRARSWEDRRHHDSHPREARRSPRRRALSPERRRPASRPHVDERRVMIVPKFVDINHGIDRRPRLERPARAPRDRTRSPHTHRPPVRSRADHPAVYEQRRDTDIPRQAQHAPTRHAIEPVWPELHAPPSGRKVEDFVRPHLDRAPIRTPEFAWDAVQYERGASHTAYPAATEYDYRHAQPEYHEPVGRDAGYRAPVYREATYSDAGYAAAAQGREVGYRQPSSYDYEEPAYRDYTGSRTMEVPHSSYTRSGASWDAPRFPHPRNDAYPHGYSASDDRCHDRELRQLPVRGNLRLPRADRDPVALSRVGSFLYSRHDRGHEGLLPARDDPHQHAPRLAHEYAAPPPRSYRDGLHQASRDVREAPRSVSRHVEGYASAVGHVEDAYAARRRPAPPPAGRRPSSRGRSPRRREPSLARVDRRRQEPTRRSQHEADRPSDRVGRSPGRGEVRGREALQLTSRSFALEAAVRQPATEPAEPGQLDVSDLPPPPAGDAPKAASSRAAKPSQASELARPAGASEPVVETRQDGEDTSPVLSVQQGFLSESAPTPAPTPAPAAGGDRPFQRGQKSQHPPDASVGKSRDRPAKADGRSREAERRSSRDHAADAGRGKDAKKPSAVAEAKHDRGRSGLDSRAELSSRPEEASNRRQDADTRHKAAAKAGADKHSERRTSTADRDERPKDKPSSGGKEAAKPGSIHHAASSKASPSAKTNNASSNKDRPASAQRPDLKRSPRSASKPDASAAKGDKAASKGGSRSDAVVAKQAGRKRRSRSGERSRSPKRQAASPATRKSGKDSDKGASTSGRKEEHLPPPPARPSSARKQDDLPPPPIRVAGKTAAEPAGDRVPNGTDQALPPPPPKPQSNDKGTSGSRPRGDLAGHAKRDSTRPAPAEEGEPASKPTADAAAKDASAKSASAKDSSAAKDAAAKGDSAKNTPARNASAKDAPTRPSGRSESAKADSKKPERQSTAGRSRASEKIIDKGHLVARDSHRGDDRPANGRAGQKRARSRSPQKPLEGSKAADGAKQQATAAASKRVDARPSRLPNGTSEKVRDADKDSQKEWMYEDKGKTLGPVSKKRLLETWQKFKAESKSKAADYMRFAVWRNGDRRKKQQMRDVLAV